MLSRLFLLPLAVISLMLCLITSYVWAVGTRSHLGLGLGSSVIGVYPLGNDRRPEYGFQFSVVHRSPIRPRTAVYWGERDDVVFFRDRAFETRQRVFSLPGIRWSSGPATAVKQEQMTPDLWRQLLTDPSSRAPSPAFAVVQRQSGFISCQFVVVITALLPVLWLSVHMRRLVRKKRERTGAAFPVVAD